MVRECRPPAREPARSWLARRSTMATSTPANANSPANISPVGPPPAITTACSVIVTLRPASRRPPPAHHIPPRRVPVTPSPPPPPPPPPRCPRHEHRRAQPGRAGRAEGFLAVAPDLQHWGSRIQCLFSFVRDSERPLGDLEATRTWLASHERCAGHDRCDRLLHGRHGADARPERLLAASVNYGGLTRESERTLPNACPIVGSYGGKDRWPGVRSTFERLGPRLTAAGIEHDLKLYPDAGHGFAERPRASGATALGHAAAKVTAASYHEPPANDAQRRIVAFFRTHLRTE